MWWPTEVQVRDFDLVLSFLLVCATVFPLNCARVRVREHALSFRACPVASGSVSEQKALSSWCLNPHQVAGMAGGRELV